MNEWEPLTEQEQDFINYLRTKRGPCPDDETLVALQEGTLTLDRAEQVQSHVGLCGRCGEAVRMLERFEQCQAEEWPDPPNWPEVERRSQARLAAFLESQKAPAPERRSRWEKVRAAIWPPVSGVSLPQAVAYLLVLALAYPAYRGLFGKPEVVTKIVPQKEIIEVEKPGPDIANLVPFELEATERAPGEGPTVVPLRPDQLYVELSFQSEVSGAPKAVSDLEVYDSRGQVVAALKDVRPRDELGNFIVRCRRDLFRPGPYELRVTVVYKSRQVERFPFLVTDE
jgi:hypothetical protein